MNSLPGNLTRQRNGMEGGSTVPPLTRCVSHFDANPQAMLSLHWVDTQCGLNMKKKIAIQSIAFHPSNKSQWLF